MVVSNTATINKRAVLEIASRKLFKMSENNPEYKKFSEQLNRYSVALGNSNLKICEMIKPPITFGNASSNKVSCSPSCLYKGVLEILERRNELFTFKEACQILGHCKENKDLTSIHDIIQKYGIVFIGFPECAEEDLFLAVHIFIEEMFGIQPKIVFCSRLSEEDEPDLVDVIFDSIVTKKKISEKHRNLEGSGILIDTYFDASWIIDRLFSGDSVESD